MCSLLNTIVVDIKYCVLVRWQGLVPLAESTFIRRVTSLQCEGQWPLIRSTFFFFYFCALGEHYIVDLHRDMCGEISLELNNSFSTVCQICKAICLSPLFVQWGSNLAVSLEFRVGKQAWNIAQGKRPFTGLLFSVIRCNRPFSYFSQEKQQAFSEMQCGILSVVHFIL